MNNTEKMNELIKAQNQDNQRQHLLNALQAAGEALTLADIILERTAQDTTNQIQELINNLSL